MSLEEPEHQEADFEIYLTESGAKESATIPANKLRIGGYALIQEHACRVVNIIKSKPGKHGHAKLSISGTDIFDGRHCEAHIPSSHEIEIPFIDRQDYELISYDGVFTQLLNMQGKIREDVELKDDEICAKIKNELNKNNSDQTIIVTVITSVGNSKIVAYKKR